MMMKKRWHRRRSAFLLSGMDDDVWCSRVVASFMIARLVVVILYTDGTYVLRARYSMYRGTYKNKNMRTGKRRSLHNVMCVCSW